jgi:hypothetical protein
MDIGAVPVGNDAAGAHVAAVDLQAIDIGLCRTCSRRNLHVQRGRYRTIAGQNRDPLRRRIAEDPELVRRSSRLALDHETVSAGHPGRALIEHADAVACGDR